MRLELDYYDHSRINQIAPPAITAYLDKRLKGGIFCGRKLQPVSERTANLDLMMLRNVLKAAMDDGHLRELPRMKMLDEAPPPKRDLIEIGRASCRERGSSAVG